MNIVQFPFDAAPDRITKRDLVRLVQRAQALDLGSPDLCRDFARLREAIEVLSLMADHEIVSRDVVLAQNAKSILLAAVDRISEQKPSTDEEVRAIRRQVAEELGASDVVKLLDTDPLKFDELSRLER